MHVSPVLTMYTAAAAAAAARVGLVLDIALNRLPDLQRPVLSRVCSMLLVHDS